MMVASIFLLGCEPKTPDTINVEGAVCVKTGKTVSAKFHGKEGISADFSCKDQAITAYFHEGGELYGIRSADTYFFARHLDKSIGCQLQNDLPEAFKDQILDPTERTFYICEDSFLMLESDQSHLLTEMIFDGFKK